MRFILLVFLALAANLNADVGHANALIKQNPEWLDFIIQDVCVDAQDRPVSGDPRTCAQRRNVRVGEKMPYLLSDWDKPHNVRYQAVFSYPVLTVQGTLGVVIAKLFGFGNQQRFAFNYRATEDGFDLLNLDSVYVSGARTSDGGCLDQVFTGNTGRTDGWILFPKTLGDGSVRHTTRIERISPNLSSGCQRASQSGYNEVLAVWSRPSMVTFENGAQLFAVVASHFAHFDLSRTNNAFERTFWTREYGWTRWEAWIPLSRCIQEHGVGSIRCDLNNQNNFLYGRCNPVLPVPAQAEWGGQSWVRVDCRDNTFYQELDEPIVPVHPEMAQSNGLQDIVTVGVGGSSIGGVVSQSQPVERYVQPEGSWSWSCQDTKIVGQFMTTNCIDMKGKKVANRVDLKTCKSADNADGRLQCAGGVLPPVQMPQAPPPNVVVVRPIVTPTVVPPQIQRPDALPPSVTIISPPERYVQPAGSWLKSCQDTKIEGKIMTTNCFDMKGRKVANRVDLKTCKNADNLDGKIQCAGVVVAPVQAPQAPPPNVEVARPVVTPTVVSPQTQKPDSRPPIVADVRVKEKYVQPEGSWFWSCFDVEVVGQTMTTNCVDMRGKRVVNRVDLRTCKNADNLDGRIQCAGQ